ncbi:MAG: TlpA disulfide reductase family protein [Gammaproteobacteria bacterium]
MKTDYFKKMIVLLVMVMPWVVWLPTVSAELVAGEAPNFTLKSQRGDNLKLSEHRGEVIMLNFWATWCDACRQGMPTLNEMYQLYRDEGFTLFSINVEDDVGKVKKSLRKMQVTFPVLFDVTNEVSKKYEVDDIPSVDIIDRDGNLRYVHHGFPPNYRDVFQKQVRELMAE